MKTPYRSPFRVYLVFLFFACIGIWSGFQLPISLFPNISKPMVWISINYQGISRESFIKQYGSSFENSLQSLKNDELKIESVDAHYYKNHVDYECSFPWGTSSQLALSETRTLVNSLKTIFPSEISDSISVSQWNRNAGFLAISFYSQSKNLDELYRYLNPMFEKELLKVQDAGEAVLWYPSKKEIKIKLDPHQMLKYGITPAKVKQSIKNSFYNFQGGDIQYSSGQKLSISMKPNIETFEELNKIKLYSNKNELIYLNSIAQIHYGTSELRQRLFKTQGAPSLILYAAPKTDGNIKRMADDIKAIIKKVAPNFTKDIQYKVLVDPSEFIQSAITNVLKEVFIAALLAVLILFLFLGNFSNIVTAAIEIPISLIMAFLLMKVFDMNLNLISLGGLALAAGMNVDASVVVLENILRHLKLAHSSKKLKLDASERLHVIIHAVKEVAAPVLVSMLTSLVVFIPLVSTQGLSNALLSDLAKAVIFSHGLSAFIALILVPTIRYQMYNPEKILHAPKPITYKLMQKVEKLYIAFLNKLLFSTKNKIIFLSSVLALFLVSILLVFPLIKKEIIGKPDSDWMIVNINSPLSKSIFQVEKKALEIEHIVFKDFPDKFKYSFVQIQSKIRATLMFRLQNKKEMNHLWKEIEKKFSNTPEHHFWVGPWNPAELPLPNPPDTKIIISGMNQENKELLADRILYKIKEQDIFDRVHAEPSNSKDDQIEFYPYQEYWDRLQGNFQLSDLFHITRLMNKGENITNLDVDGLKTDINMYYQSNLLNSTQDLKSLYIPYNNQLLPFEALGEFKRTRENSNIKRHNGQSVIEIIANQNRDKKSIKYEKFQQIKNIITENPEYFKLSGTHISMEDPDFTFNDSYSELQKALAISLFLIFFILLLQFQNFIDVFSIMLAIPLGLIGVSFSLFIFDSTLSLNSCLGIILLNGICVNNSLLLIDFCRKLQKSGIDIKFAMLEACKKRLRPILITSLTTIMGMLPIAFAYGDGGSILQPLGIAVSGGLGISTILTLVCIPIIYTSISSNKEIRPQQVKNNHPIPEVENQL